MGDTSGTDDRPSPWASPGFSPGSLSPDEPQYPSPSAPELGQPSPQAPEDPPFPYTSDPYASGRYPPSAGADGAPPAGPAADHPPGAHPQGAGAPTPGRYTFPALEKQPLEPLAIGSLLTSPISPLGLGLGIGALRRLRRNRRRGTGVAIAGVILSSLFLAATLLLLATLALDGTFARLAEEPAPGDISATRTASPVNLAEGNCVVTLPVTSEVGEVTVTPCAEEHQLQVIDRISVDGGEFAATGGDYPGAAELFAHAEQACAASFGALEPSLQSPADFVPSHIVPSEGNWAAGERNVLCFARSTAGPVTADLIDGSDDAG